MAKRRRGFGSTEAQHKDRARDAIKYVRQDVRQFRRAVAAGNCHGALHALRGVEFYSGMTNAERRGTGRRKNLFNMANLTNKLSNKVEMCFIKREKEAVASATAKKGGR